MSSQCRTCSKLHLLKFRSSCVEKPFILRSGYISRCGQSHEAWMMSFTKIFELKRQISQIPLGPCSSHCYEKVWGIFPLYWTGLVCGNDFIVPRLGGVSFYCSQVWGEKLQLQSGQNTSGSIHGALSDPVCLYALPNSLLRFLLRTQEQPGGTSRDSGFTGYSLTSLLSQWWYLAHHSVDMHPDILLPSSRLPGPSIPALPCSPCPPLWTHSSLIPLQVQTLHVETKASWRKSLQVCQTCCLPDWSSV